MRVLKVAFLKFGLKIFVPRKEIAQQFSHLVASWINKFSHSVLGRLMDFIPGDPTCCSFHNPVSFLPP